MTIDGVTSFVLHLSAALSRGGHEVAVLGRWWGKGFQSRLRLEGVRVIQCLSPTIGNFWFDRRAAEFGPDVIVTDSNRSFPLSQRLKKITGAKVFTFFLDPIQDTAPIEEKAIKKGRDIGSLTRGSDAWFSTDEIILKGLENFETPFPRFILKRPLKGLINPTPFPPMEPFRVLCIGRLSRRKHLGPLSLLNDAVALKKKIPSLEFVFVGGGGKTNIFRYLAWKANRRAGARFVRVVGAQAESQPWYDWATIVCAGSTSAVEAILANRLVIAFTDHWFGLVTPTNMEQAFRTFFAQRETGVSVRERPGIVSDHLSGVYEAWDHNALEDQVAEVRKMVEPHFDSASTARDFEDCCRMVFACEAGKGLQ